MKPFWTAKRFYALLFVLGVTTYHQIRTKQFDVDVVAGQVAAVVMFIVTYDGSQPLTVHTKKQIRRKAEAAPRRGNRLTRD